MRWFSKKEDVWTNKLTDITEWQNLLELSNTKPIAIFKHSTRCSISAMAKSRIEREWQFNKDQLPLYYLDLIQHRDISNQIAKDTKVKHESPQLIVINKKQVVYTASHNMISVAQLQNELDTPIS